MPPSPGKRMTSRLCRPACSRPRTRRSPHDSARQSHLGCGSAPEMLPNPAGHTGELAARRRWDHVTHQPPTGGIADSPGELAFLGRMPVGRSRPVLPDLIVWPVPGPGGTGEGDLCRVPGSAGMPDVCATDPSGLRRVEGLSEWERHPRRLRGSAAAARSRCNAPDHQTVGLRRPRARAAGFWRITGR
jgi:hypothetical protein